MKKAYGQSWIDNQIEWPWTDGWRLREDFSGYGKRWWWMESKEKTVEVA
jgi:hypothetical protein